jgi:hypothetical protein
MPNYSQSSNVNPITALFPGQKILLFNAETPAPGQNSIAVNLPALQYGGRSQAQLSFSISYASAPTAVLTVMAANDDVAASYIATSTTSTNKQTDRLELATNAPFVLIQLTSQSAGGAVTVELYRAA